MVEKVSSLHFPGPVEMMPSAIDELVIHTTVMKKRKWREKSGGEHTGMLTWGEKEA